MKKKESLQPLAFLHTTWREELLPNERYHQLWKQLQSGFDLDSAAVLMVEALYIAATQNKEAAVAVIGGLNPASARAKTHCDALPD